MRSAAVFILIAVLQAALPGHVVAAPAPPPGPIGAGTETGGWVALPYPDTRPPAIGSAEPRSPLHQLYFLPTDTPPGALYGATVLPEAPSAIAASGSRVVLLFDPAALQSSGGSPHWTVRALTAVDQPEPLPPVFEPPGRLEILPALKAGGDVVGFCGVPGGGVAALIRPVSDATGSPIGGDHTLRALIGGVWRDVTLPAPIPASTPSRLLPSANGVLVLVPDDKNPGQVDLWRGVFPAAMDRSELAVKPQWRRETITLKDFKAPLVVVAGDHLLSATRTDKNGAVRLTLLLPGSSTELATLDGIPDPFALTRVGDTVSLVYLSESAKPQIMTAAVHASTGEILHQGPHVKVSPLSTDDLRFLGFVLALVLMTALVFVLRPSAAASAEVSLPHGTALASPERRLAAGLIDFAIPVLIVVQIWRISVMDLLLAPIQAQSANEFWPFAIASVAFFAHSVVSEWLFHGRTIGKAILRIRVSSIIGDRGGRGGRGGNQGRAEIEDHGVERGGDRLSLWQSVCRNTIKLVCPPLLILIFVDPRRRHPGDTIAGAVVIARAKGPEPRSGDGAEDDDDDDDGPGRSNEAPVADG